ncbi:uncharacterized protein LOC108737219 [Agrilus planipennis]|uniref:Uncharacterized protein LOC108737219 n=1 Tax=Agrilus planipennis TaxID=224129 RepID=A0A1W4WZF2_AGRPL|nr:uncharacterized protein LOC108737219 [Agrilus planipennis]XP_018325446.1 uncharacterized protein LOC108737219 [Agrilus planipennis]
MPPTAKMSSGNIVCPVCTLFLRPGMTLTSHLGSHPKQKVIEALVRISLNQSTGCRDLAIINTNENVPNNNIVANHESNGTQTFLDEPVQQKPDPTQNFGVVSGNHSFIYQQFMSTSSQQSTQTVLNGNPMAPQYITIPTVFSPQMAQLPPMAQMPQMVCSPYVYQQQQVIMSSGPSMPPLLPKPVPISQHMHVPPMHPPILPPAIEAPANSYDERDGYILIDNDKPSCNETVVRPCSRSSINSIIMSPVTSCHEDYRSQASMSPVYSPDSQVDTTKDECNVEDNCKKEDPVKNDDDEPFLTNETVDNNNGDCSQKNLERFEEEQKDEKDGDANVPLEAVDLFGGEAIQPDVIITQKSNCPSSDYYNREGALNTSNCVEINNSYNLEDPVFTISNAFGENEAGNVSSLDNINLILPPDFTSGQFISRVEDFENIHQDDKRIIMNIGCMDNNNSERIIEHLGEESISQASENVSIRADEHMPARGELSGPESNGAASDTVWGRLNYEGNSRISASYDTLQESWDASDGSFTDVPPLQSRNIAGIDCRPDENDDSPTVISVIAPPKNFKCSICGDAFDCLKERRLHHRLKHKGENERNDNKSSKEAVAITNTVNVVGAKIGTKKTKKLIIKSKPTTTENNFDNVFTNKIRSQQQQDEEEYKEESDVLQSPPIKEEDVKLIKTELVSCHLCDRTFPSIKLLKSHSSLEHNLNMNVESKRQCAVCEENFQTESEFHKHLMIHPLECRICGKCFYRKQNMQLHMKRHLGIRPYKCDICGKSFLTKQKCSEHRNIHTGETPVRCRLCNETFKRHSNLIQHRNKHHFNVPTRVKRDYICFCGEVVHSKKKLAWHKEIHEMKPKACLYCSEKFVHSASLTRHMRRAHNQHFVPEKDRSSENVECPICKKIYLRSSLDAHIRSHSGQKSFTCPVCNKDFTTKWNLKLHKWTHAARSSKPFKCDQCRGAFIRESEYVAHMNSHKSVRPYTCNHCGAQFIRKYNCQRHVKEHLLGKSFSCNICGKTFHRSYYLKDHMRVHNGTRPYACHVCGKTSTTKSNHNKHIRIHHAREPVSTEN